MVASLEDIEFEGKITDVLYDNSHSPDFERGKVIIRLEEKHPPRDLSDSVDRVFLTGERTPPIQIGQWVRGKAVKATFLDGIQRYLRVTNLYLYEKKDGELIASYFSKRPGPG